jgi:hypothetical protein
VTVEVVNLKALDASKSGDLEARFGVVSISGHPLESAEGTMSFELVHPSKMVRWMAAEIVGDFAQDSVRVRLTDGVKTYFFDEENNLEVTEVDDPSQWDVQWSEASLLNNLDLWTSPNLGFSVHLVRTEFDRNPRVVEIRVLMDLPTWHGATAHAVRSVAEFVSSVHPLMVHSEVLSEDQQSWKIGEPYTEINLNVVELVQVTLDGSHKSATLADGIVTLVGPPGRKGQTIEIAAKFKPNITVRRTEHVDVLHQVPAWWVQNLVGADQAMNGFTTKVSIGGYEVAVRRVELRMTINGVASRTVDALAMRAALQQATAYGVPVTMPSGRQVFGFVDSLVDVAVQGGGNLPMTSGKVNCAFMEYVSARQIRRSRTDDMQPVRTTVDVELPDGVQETVDNEAVEDRSCHH